MRERMGIARARLGGTLDRCARAIDVDDPLVPRATGDESIEERRRRATDLELTWRFEHADAESTSVPSGLEVLAAVCLSGGPRRRCKDPAKLGVPFTQRHVDAIDRARRTDRILATLRPQHAAALRAKYDEPALPEVVRGVWPDDTGVAYVTDAAHAAFALAARPRTAFPAWLESLCTRIASREASPADEVVVDDITFEMRRLVSEAVTAYAMAADRFDARERRLWVA